MKDKINGGSKEAKCLVTLSQDFLDVVSIKGL